MNRHQESNDRQMIGVACWTLGCAELAGKAYTATWQWLEESVAAFRQLGKQDRLSYSLATLVYAAHRLAQVAEAEQYLAESLLVAAEIRVFWTPLYPLPAVALLLADEGKAERAVELYALALRYPFVANSCWFEGVVGTHLAAVAAALPPDVVTASQNLV